MAAQVLTASAVYVDDTDFTGYSNQAELRVAHDMKTVTNFGSGAWDELIPGLTTSELGVAGFWETALDAPEWAAVIAKTNRVTTYAPTGVEGEAAYLFRSKDVDYQFFGDYGEPVPFTVAARGSDGIGSVRGRLCQAKADVTSTGATGTGVQLTGGVAADEFGYASLHVFSAGTTITVVVESDDNAGFTSATTQATFGPITTAGGTWATRFAGPITDDYYRFRITAISGTFSIAGAIGIR